MTVYPSNKQESWILKHKEKQLYTQHIIPSFKKAIATRTNTQECTYKDMTKKLTTLPRKISLPVRVKKGTNKQKTKQDSPLVFPAKFSDICKDIATNCE